MPEFRGLKITRAEELARHAYRRALEKALRTAAKGSGWKCAGGVLFREDRGWFIDVSPAVYIFERKTVLSVHLKPMALDPIFWEMVDTPDSVTEPLSFRYMGAWTCRPPPITEVGLDEHEMAADEAAREMVSAASAQTAGVSADWTTERFLKNMQRHKHHRERGAHLAPIVVTLCLLDRLTEARDLCLAAKARGDHGGFTYGTASFPDMALAWIGKHSTH